MAISDKTRKLIWVKTGNRCAFCRQKLVIDETESDSESVVGDECHIISESENGPRFDSTYPKRKIDTDENLIVLCRTHHKMIDDQVDTYTAEILRSIKKNHENWVESKLTQTETIKPVRIVRDVNKIPKELMRITSGKQLFNMASTCSSYYQDFPDELTSSETDIVGGFIQNVIDWSELSAEIEPLEKVRACKSISDDLENLHNNDFLVFASTEEQSLEGGVGTRSSWNDLHLIVTRNNDPRIVKKET